MDLAWHNHERLFTALARTTSARRHVRTWATLDPELDVAGVHDPAAFVVWARRRPTVATDPAFAALARLSVRGDHLAAATLLRCLHPGLARVAAGYDDPDLDHRDVVDTIVGLCWERIVTYPIDRRPRMVALNILLDVRQWWSRSRQRANRIAARETALDEQPDHPAGSATVEDGAVAGEVLRYLFGRLPAGDVEILVRTHVREQTAEEAALAMGLPYRSVLTRRAHAEERCRQLAAA